MTFAIEAHDKVNQTYDGKPYFVHLSMVHNEAIRFINLIPPHCRENVLNAVWLHDTIEDCRLTYNDILKISNNKVADLVYAVTNEKGKNREERANEKYYKGIRETEFAVFIKLCDRLANVIYSRVTNSKMFDVYKKENEEFLNHLFERPDQQLRYRELVQELKDALHITPATVNTYTPDWDD